MVGAGRGRKKVREAQKEGRVYPAKRRLIQRGGGKRRGLLGQPLLFKKEKSGLAAHV